MTSCHAPGCGEERAAFTDFCPAHGPADAPVEKVPKKSDWQMFKEGMAAPPPPTKAQVKAQQQARIVCPHCQTAGKVKTKDVKTKKGISGGKATGAVLTGGASILATGLSRKEKGTEAHCGNCGVTWHI